MRIYTILPQLDKVQNILPCNDENGKYLNFRGESKLKDWFEIEVYVFNPLREKANFFLLRSGVSALIMDEYAADTMNQFWGLSGELLPIRLETGEKLFILNVLEVVNALNQEETIFDYYSDGTRGRILQPVFHDSRFPESSIFKIPETVRTEILTYSGVKGPEDEFYTAYLDSNLTGLEFELKYSK